MNIIKHLLFSSVFLAPLCLAQNKIKHYDPMVEQLNGTVAILIFPGKPNYTSIKNGDAIERCPYLLLDKPIDVTMKTKNTSKSQESYEPEKNIRLVQLVVTNHTDWKFMRNGNKITVYGTLFGAFTGHHHAKVLIEVQKCSLADIKISNSKVKLKKNIAHSLYPGEFDKMQIK